MTINEMHRLFKVLCDKVDTGAAPDFSPPEIDLFLNAAQDRLVKARFAGGGAGGFEQTQKRADDLRTLQARRHAALVPAGSGLVSVGLASFYADEALSSAVADKYLFLTRLEIRLGVPGSNPAADAPSRWVVSRPWETRGIRGDDPLQAPVGVVVRHLFSEGALLVSHDPRLEAESCRVWFVRAPRAMRLSAGAGSDLADHLHEEIVSAAVALALESVESPRQQTFPSVSAAALAAAGD